MNIDIPHQASFEGYAYILAVIHDMNCVAWCLPGEPLICLDTACHVDLRPSYMSQYASSHICNITEENTVHYVGLASCYRIYQDFSNFAHAV